MKHQKFNEAYPYGYFLVRKSDGMKYVGIRYANVKYNLTPSEDFGKVYFTSGRMEKQFKANPEDFEFKIKHTFDSISELFEWERKIALRIYKRPDWANQGWGQNYGENPIIGQLISEGKNKPNNLGITSVQRGAEVLKDWIWNTEEGLQHRLDIGERISKMRSEWSAEKQAEVNAKRNATMDFKAASQKAQETMRSVGEDGLNTLQRKAAKSHERMRLNGSASLVGKARDEKYTRKLGEMSEEEFENWCSGRSKRTVSGAISRRNKYLKQIKEA